jgi:exodeoxyribonuclease V beta subunit
LRFGGMQHGDRALTNLRHLIELLPAELHTAARAAQWLVAQRHRSRDDAPLRMESDHNAITIQTIHAAKGLEFAVVVLPFMWVQPELRMPEDLSAVVDGERVLVFNCNAEGETDPRFQPEALRAASEAEQRAEQLRLAYVALTRARDVCALAWPISNDAKKIATERDSSAMGRVLRGRSWAELAAQCSALQVVESAAGNDPLSGEISGVTNSEEKSQLLSVSKDKYAIKTSALSAQPATRDVAQSWRHTSFTSLWRGAQQQQQPQQDEGRDHDHDHDRHGSRTAPNPNGARDLRFSFPAGAAAGVALHSLFEQMDFADESTWARPVAQTLSSMALGDEHHSGLVQWLRDLAVHPLGFEFAPTANLRGIARAAQHREWPFVMSLQGNAGDASQALSSLGLMQDAAAPLALPRGYLQGVIDAVVRVGERYWVLDYKSNFLGDSAADYSEPRLKLAMNSSGYTVQAAIYCVALHRALHARVRDYDPAKHFGGVAYLFVRGMGLGAQPDGMAGVWRRQFSPAQLELLSSVFEKAAHG